MIISRRAFKGNSRGDFIQEQFTTLEEMFKKLPEQIGFNIEMSESLLPDSKPLESSLTMYQSILCSTNQRSKKWTPMPWS